MECPPKHIKRIIAVFSKHGTRLLDDLYTYMFVIWNFYLCVSFTLSHYLFHLTKSDRATRDNIGIKTERELWNNVTVLFSHKIHLRWIDNFYISNSCVTFFKHFQQWYEREWNWANPVGLGGNVHRGNYFLSFSHGLGCIKEFVIHYWACVYHGKCCTQIVVSLFVAVILDNLELDEDIKKIKQVRYILWMNFQWWLSKLIWIAAFTGDSWCGLCYYNVLFAV